MMEPELLFRVGTVLLISSLLIVSYGSKQIVLTLSKLMELPLARREARPIIFKSLVFIPVSLSAYSGEAVKKLKKHVMYLKLGMLIHISGDIIMAIVSGHAHFSQ